MKDLEEMYLDAFFARVDAGELIILPHYPGDDLDNDYADEDSDAGREALE
jgi:hypothetical protein